MPYLVTEVTFKNELQKQKAINVCLAYWNKHFPNEPYVISEHEGKWGGINTVIGGYVPDCGIQKYIRITRPDEV